MLRTAKGDGGMGGTIGRFDKVDASCPPMGILIDHLPKTGEGSVSDVRGDWLCSMGLLVGLIGCASSHCTREDCTADLPTVERSAIEPQFPADGLSPLPAPPADCYRGLTPHDCQCQAVKASGLGKLLAAHADSQGEGNCLTRLLSPSSSLHRKIVEYAAEDARNRSAAEALEAYYQLAEAEGRTDLLLLSQGEVDETAERLEELVKQGVRQRSELDTVRRQQNDLKSDAAQARMTIEQLNLKLKTLLNLTCGTNDCRIWPLVKLSVKQEPIDVADAVAKGLAERPDLKLLRTVLHDLNCRTLPAVEKMLSSVNVLLTGPPSPQGPVSSVVASILVRFATGGVSHVREGLESLLKDREQQAAAEIRSAIQEIEAHYQRTILAREQMALTAKKVAELDEKKKKGMGDAELTRARLDHFKVRGDLLHEVAAWEIGHVHLRQAQGLLVQECKDGASCDCASGKP
jgi:hypothetical protein